MEPAYVTILYNNKDISRDISLCLSSFSYTDKTSGESDEIAIKLHNKDGLWGLEWYPEKGAEIVAQIINGLDILDCGKFYIDSLQDTGSKSDGDYITIKGLGAGIKEGIRTINSHANENKTLKQIAAGIAAKYKWKVAGNVPEVRIGRTTQHRETDLHYLSRIAAQFGIIFNVRGDTITFTSIFDLENSTIIKTFSKRDIISRDITDKTLDVYIQATSEHYNTKSKKVISFTTPSGAVIPFASTTSGNYLNIKSRAENQQQADLISKAAIYGNNSLQQEGHITIPGDLKIVAGVNIALTELGNFSGNYHTIGTTHTVEKGGGYVTNLEIKRIGLLAYEQMKDNAANEESSEALGENSQYPGEDPDNPIPDTPGVPEASKVYKGPVVFKKAISGHAGGGTWGEGENKTFNTNNGASW